MILRLIHPGNTGKGPLAQASDDYRARLSRYLRTEECFVKSHKLKKEQPQDVARALEEEAARIRSHLGHGTQLIVLDKGGEQVSSEALAKRLQSWLSSGHRATVFALGSAHGLSPELIRSASWAWSFGKLMIIF